MDSGFPIPWALLPLALAAAWMLAAWGYGTWIHARFLDGDRAHGHRSTAGASQPGTRSALAIGLGTAFLLALDSLLASAGALRAGTGGCILSWTVIAGGIVAAIAVQRRSGASPRTFLGPWRLAWPAIASVAVLAAVAALPPGVAWATEFGGYDALGYHLQLPKEWIESGRVAPLRHCAYSAFPNFMETATIHLWTMASSAPVHRVACAAQWLHALVAIAAALVTGALAGSLLPDSAGPRARQWATGVGTVAMLGIPWVVVTGSLAYNDMAPVLLLSTAMLAWASRDHAAPARTGAAVGLALGAALGSKLTAVGMVAVPFAAWAAAGSVDRRTLVRAATAAVAVAVVVLLPWIARNWATIGNPVFPFAGEAPGWWTAEQFARFAAGHGAAPGTGLAGRVEALWDHGFREGFGAAPGPDPWLPQWGLAFAAGCGAIAVATSRAPRTGLALLAMLCAQAIFWMLATHLKARFLLPCAVPMCAAAGVAFAPRGEGAAGRGGIGAAAALSAALVAWSLQPFAVLRMDPRMSGPGSLGTAAWSLGGALPDLGPGTAADASAAAADGAPLPLAWIANWQLPPGAVLGCEGEADVFWCRTTPAWGTVWDGGPLARALRAHPGDPDAAVAALRAEGLTHLAIGESMLSRWKDAGWLDPALEPARVRAVAARLRPLAPLASGGTVYEVPPAAQP